MTTDKPDKKTSKPDKQPRKKAPSAYGIFIVIYLILGTGLLIYLNLVAKTSERTLFGFSTENFINYPPVGLKTVVFNAAVIFIGVFLILDFFLISRVKGWKKFVVNLIVIIAFFGTLEAAARDFMKNHPVKFRPHHSLIWSMNPNFRQDNIKTNSLGFRYPDFPVKKEKNEYRFLLLGDSTTWGFNVSDEERYGTILEKKLQEAYPDRKIRVINAAVEGYSSLQAKNMAKIWIDRLNPDCIIVAINNDLGSEILPDSARTAHPKLMPLFKTLYKSEVYLLLRRMLLNRRLSKAKKKRDSLKPGEYNDTTVKRVSFDEARQNYSTIVKLMKKRNKDAIIISLPMPKFWQKNEFDYKIDDSVKHRKVMEEVCRENGALFVDVFDKWRKDPEKDKLFMDIVHPTADGHKIIADEVFNKIIESKIIK